MFLYLASQPQHYLVQFIPDLFVPFTVKSLFLIIYHLFLTYLYHLYYQKLIPDYLLIIPDLFVPFIFFQKIKAVFTGALFTWVASAELCSQVVPFHLS
jgi:hypothetical protein